MIRLSPSTVSLFKSCPKCFWVNHHHKVARPRGIFPSIPTGIDTVLKNSVEHDHARGIAIQYLESVPGASAFPDRAHLNAKLRNWRTFAAEVIVSADHKVTLLGAIDDLIQFEDGTVAPWDFKSNGSERDWDAYAKTYYQSQLDIYGMILEHTGHRLADRAFLTFVWPTLMRGGAMEFSHATIGIPYCMDATKSLVANAVSCLYGPMPSAADDCEYCTFVGRHIAGGFHT